jgi:hypothetical protein
MTASIIEHSDGISIIVVTGQDGEHHYFDIMETDGREALGQIEYEAFHDHVVFKYALLGAPNAHIEETSDVNDREDENARDRESNIDSMP